MIDKNDRHKYNMCLNWTNCTFTNSDRINKKLKLLNNVGNKMKITYSV